MTDPSFPLCPRYSVRMSRYRPAAHTGAGIDSAPALLGRPVRVEPVRGAGERVPARPRARMPGFAGRCLQLTEARAENPWLAEGSVVVQQQALPGTTGRPWRTFSPVTARRPRWRKAGVRRGLPGRRGRAQADVRRLNRTGHVRVPKAGWVRFRWSRAVPAERVAPADPGPRGPLARRVRRHPRAGAGTGDRGSRGGRPGRGVSAALSTGETLVASHPDRQRASAASRAPAQASARRARVGPPQPGEVRHRPTEGPRDSTAPGLVRECVHGIARRFDVIRVEALRITNMSRPGQGGASSRRGVERPAEGGLNREILRSDWGVLVRRLEDKAPGFVDGIAGRYQRDVAVGEAQGEARDARGGLRQGRGPRTSSASSSPAAWSPPMENAS